MPTRTSGEKSDIRLHLLVLRCQTGDETAFVELYRMFSDRTLRYLRGLLDTHTAEDIQQEVWLTVYRMVAGVTNPKRFRTWLYQTTRHRAIDSLRRCNRQVALIERTSEDFVEDMQYDEILPEGLQDSSEIRLLLKRLSPAHREVLILKYWEDLSYAEIATIVGRSVGTVRSRIHHAKQNVKKLLAVGTATPIAR
jgi:RNA polymerase sigma-70 factor (ECF subfamily)